MKFYTYLWLRYDGTPYYAGNPEYIEKLRRSRESKISNVHTVKEQMGLSFNDTNI